MPKDTTMMNLYTNKNRDHAHSKLLGPIRAVDKESPPKKKTEYVFLNLIWAASPSCDDDDDADDGNWNYHWKPELELLRIRI